MRERRRLGIFRLNLAQLLCECCFKLFLRGLLSFRAVFCSRAASASAALVWRSEQSLLTRLWLLLNFCQGLSSQRDILDSANLPPFLEASTPAVAVRALPRVSAQLSTSARSRGGLARRGLGRGAGGQFRWVGSLGFEVAGPWPSRGSVEGPYPRLCGLYALLAPRDKIVPLIKTKILPRASLRESAYMG